MRMDREKAFFADSRLYRQAEETADHLLASLPFPVPLADAIMVLRRAGCGQLLRPGELDRPLTVLHDEIERSIDSISPYHAIPALFRAVAKLQPPRPAAAVTFKTLAIRIQRRVWTGSPGLSASRSELARAARLAYAEQLLRSLQGTWAIQPAGHAEITANGLLPDQETNQLLQAASRATSGGGTLQRFSGDTVRRMSADPVAFLLGACAVLAGDPPAAQRSFSGSYLALLPGADVAASYWFGLTARLFLLETIRQFARPVHDDPRGITILGPSGGEVYGPAIDRLSEQDMASLQREVMACFWNRRWLASIPPGIQEAHAFVIRPACRILRSRALYVTSAPNVVDSITTFTEQAVGPYPGPRPYALPQSVFETLLSKPFEVAVVSLLREHGFLAGEVTRNGAWLTQEGPKDRPARFNAPRGQIDVLAWHPTGYVVVADCKVLQLPSSEAALINMWKKLQDDDEGFRRKLKASANWCTKFLEAIHKNADSIRSLLILDQPFHLWRQSGDIILTHYADLAEKLESHQIP